MQSIATVMFMRGRRLGAALRPGALFALGLQYFLAAVMTARADVVAQVHLARGRLDGERRIHEEIVGAVHAALGRGFLVLLDGHLRTPSSNQLLRPPGPSSPSRPRNLANGELPSVLL